MRRGVGVAVTLMPALVLVLGGCAPPAVVPAEPGPVRAHWQLHHRIAASAGATVVEQRMDAYEEATTVSFGRDADGNDIQCFASVSTPGRGGPENKVGEQVTATVQGRPALRNGAGAEGDYLMWQGEDGAWRETGCAGEGQRRYQDRLAAAVRTAPTSVRLPFRVAELPTGYRVDSIVAEASGTTSVSVSRGEVSLLLAFDRSWSIEGRTITVAGRSATLNESPTHPGLCTEVQSHQVCVAADPGDTGPYPDISGELPAIQDIAAGLRFPADLDDRSSWYPADEVFG